MNSAHGRERVRCPSGQRISRPCSRLSRDRERIYEYNIRTHARHLKIVYVIPSKTMRQSAIVCFPHLRKKTALKSVCTARRRGPSVRREWSTRVFIYAKDKLAYGDGEHFFSSLLYAARSPSANGEVFESAINFNLLYTYTRVSRAMERVG